MKQYIQKNSIKTLAALLIAAAGMTFTACSGDDSDSSSNTQPQPQPQQPGVYTMTVQATKGGDAETRALADNGSTLTATWATTENIYVKKESTWATGTLKPQSAAVTANLKGSLSGVTFEAGNSITLQFPKSGTISYSGQKGTLADIAANYDWATANVTIASVTNGEINVTGPVEFQNQQAIIKFTLQDKGNSNAAISPTALTINDGTSDIVSLTGIPAATYTTNGAGVLYVALPAVTNKTITLTATVGSDTYKLTTTATKSFSAGKFYRVIAQMTKQALPGFTISDDNGTTKRQIYFSPGNLQAVIASGPTNSYNYTASSWKFADNQWETIGNNPGNTTFAAGTTVDLFGWVGTSASYDTYGLCTQTSANNAYYGTSTSDALKHDWGTLTITNGGGYTWFTLTTNEWNYLFTGRTNASSRYGHGSVNGVNGMIILPDSWTLPSGLTFTAGNSAWANNYTTVQWSQMEFAGAVFLPAAGSRNGSTVYNAGSDGNYWSSSPYTSYASYAYSVNFGSGGLDPQSYYYRSRGYSVRLVRVAN